jgi:hypothetical protein
LIPGIYNLIRRGIFNNYVATRLPGGFPSLFRM